jgi:hypothetical protein
VLPEAQALEGNVTPLRGVMIFLQRKINTLPQNFTSKLEDGSRETDDLLFKNQFGRTTRPV